MSLASDFISQFVKITNDKKETPSETTVYGKTVEYNGKMYVRLDGSDLLTPIATTTDVKADERVTVMIKNHTATVTGNLSSPAARTDDVKDVAGQITEFDVIVSHTVNAEDLEAINATIGTLKATSAKISNADILNAEIDNLEVKYGNVEHLNANDIKAINADFERVGAMFGEFEDLTTEDLEAVNANIDNLKAYTAEFTYVSTDVLEAVKASIKELDVNKLTAKEADLKYANIDFSNIGEAAIEHFYATSGLIKDVVVGDGTITGELVGVTIKGDLIEGGTVVADKLVIKGEDGIYYKLNTEGGAVADKEITKEKLQNGLHGSVIIANTITAEKVNVHDLVAFDATIGGFNITDDSIYSGVKSSVDNTTRGIYLDNTGQIAFGDGNNYLRYFLDGDVWRLEIAAKTIKFASGKTVEEVIESVQNDVKKTQDNLDNLEIGGRNLIRNSINMIFQDYYFYEPGESDPTELSVEHDGAGNVTVYGATATHDGEGNVTLIY